MLQDLGWHISEMSSQKWATGDSGQAMYSCTSCSQIPLQLGHTTLHSRQQCHLENWFPQLYSWQCQSSGFLPIGQGQCCLRGGALCNLIGGCWAGSSLGISMGGVEGSREQLTLTWCCLHKQTFQHNCKSGKWWREVETHTWISLWMCDTTKFLLVPMWELKIHFFPISGSAGYRAWTRVQPSFWAHLCSAQPKQPCVAAQTLVSLGEPFICLHRRRWVFFVGKEERAH
jgi:hypothetical protein